MVNRNKKDTKIKTYGAELVMIGVVAFIAIIAFTILTYKVFIKNRVTKSEEYKTATYYIVNSDTLKEQLLAPMESMSFRDLQVAEKDNYGVCEITFDLKLQNGLTEEIRLGLVKVADFWIVYQAALSPDLPSEYYLVSSYQKVLFLLDRLSYQDPKTALQILDLIKKEIRDPNLLDYLSARVNALDGNYTYASQLLKDLLGRVAYSRLSVLFEIAMIHFSELEYDKSVKVFKQIIAEYEKEKAKEDRYSRARSIFSGLPKDPFIASFSHDNVLSDAYQNLALSYYHLGEYKEGLEMAEKAYEQADISKSKTVKSSSIFVKALNLFKLERYTEAEREFTNVIEDLDNTNLSQKAWAYYYKGKIAADTDRHSLSLDYYETAVNLDPFNYLIRKGVIEYLLSRNKSGDLEIALGMALRGVQYDVEPQSFKDIVAKINLLLGLPKKTSKIQKPQ